MNLNSLLRNIRKKNLTAATLRRSLRHGSRLRVETLEDRAVPATVPTVLSVIPATGGTLTTNIQVKFSEDVSGAGTVANYSLFAQDGTVVPFTVNYVGASATATITPSVALQAGTYSLFIKGDQIVDLDGDNLRLAQPGEVVVANNNGQNLSTISLADTHLSDPTSQALPTQGATAFQPKAIASADIDGDGLADLIVAGGNLTFNSASVFVGKPDGGFSTVPAVQLALPIIVNNGNFPSNPTSIVATDLNADGTVDIAVANRDSNNVSVFLNQTFFVGDPIRFSTRADFAAGNAPVGIVAGRFNNDANVDLAVVNATADAGNNFTVNVLTGTGTGTFNPTTAFQIGTTGPTGVTNPTSIAVGNFDGNTRDDLVAGGANTGLAVMINTSAGAIPAFTVTPVNVGAAVTSVATGIIRTGTTATSVSDIIATTTSNGGGLVGALNNGTGAAFQPLGVSAAGVTNPGSIHLTNLTGDFHPEVQYDNAAVNGGIVARPAVQAGLITNASNTAVITITSANHGLQNGQQVVIAGVQGNTSANGTFYVSGVTANTFNLVGAPAGNGAYTANTGTWMAVPGIITGATGNAVSPIVITSPHHGLRTGQQVTITGVGGNTNANSPAGTGGYFITVIDADHFSLNGTTGNGTYTVNTGSYALPVDPTGSSPVGIVLTDFSPKLDALGKPVLDVNNNPILRDGLPDIVSANNGSSNLTMYTGSPAAAATGDGTFYDSSNVPLANVNRHPGKVTVGDLNGDGITDLVVPVQASNELQVFFGLAAGGYNGIPTVLSTTTNGAGPVSVAIGDVNGDGAPDILVANRTRNNVAIFLNSGTGTFPATPSSLVTVGNTPTGLVLADINEDGAADIIVSHNGGSNANRGVTVRLGNGDGTFLPATELLTGTSAVAIAVADFNRDGHADLAVADDQPLGSGVVHVLKGNGAGTFATLANPFTGPNPVDLAVADFNNDGFPDVVTVSRSTTTFNDLSVLISNAGTGFQPAIQTTLQSDSPLQSVVPMHVNQDPYVDLVVTSVATAAGSNNNNVQVLAGVGDGSFDNNVVGYTAQGISNLGTPTLPPTSATVVSDPFKLLTSFDVVSQTFAWT